jgi:bifunctional DNA-binding transcriptional regulator/antitoxin component of YhaV-PrlF toxin-antitoxin module
MGPVWVKLAENGRVGLPAAVRRQAGLRKGDQLWARVDEEGVVTLMTAEAAVRRAQRRARKLFGEKLPTIDDVIAYKREQAALEERKMRRLLGEEIETVDEVA